MMFSTSRKLVGVIRLGGGINWRAFVRPDELPVLANGCVLLYRR